MLTFNKTGADDLLTSKEAAAFSGYSPDYVDQLCREGKVECRMIRDTWYIRKQSLLAHKNSAENATSKPSENITRTKIVSGVVSSASTKSVKISKSGKLIKMVRVPTVRRNFTDRKLTRLHSAIQQGSAKVTKILTSHVTSMPSKDFWHKALSIITAIVLVFGSYHLTQSGILSVWASRMSLASENLRVSADRFVRKGTVEIVRGVIKSPQIIATVLEKSIKSAKGNIEMGAKTVSIAAKELRTDPFGYFLRTGYVLTLYVGDVYQGVRNVSLSLVENIKYTAMVGKMNSKR